MKVKISLLLLILFTSCNVKKQALKNKEDRKLTEQTEVITKRKGDTVTYVIPNIKYKDTTIYTVNRQGTTLRTVYDNTGNIQQIDCFASMIEEITRSNRELVEAIKQKEVDKEENFNPTNLFYAIGFVLLIVLVGFWKISTKL